jgi:hypothetical protein
MNKKNAQVTAHFTHEDQQAILALASEEGITASEWIRNLVTTHLDAQKSHVARMVDMSAVFQFLAVVVFCIGGLAIAVRMFPKDDDFDGMA